MTATKTTPADQGIAAAKADDARRASIDVSTHLYERSHRKLPRGWGQWGFFFDGNEAEPFWHNGTYANAKKMAIAWARTKGHVHIEVAP